MERRSDEQRCPSCGATPDRVVHAVQRSREVRLVHFRCTECHREWTRSAPAPDIAEEVSSEEVLDVHQLLGDPDLKLEDLLGG